MDFLTAMGGTATGFFGAVIPFLFVLTVVVFVHEMGHFLVGRWCGVGVHAFSIGFGPELVGFNDRHGTRWKLCAIPLGGYVKFHGDANGASVPDPETIARMSPHERAISFPTQPVAKRAAIVVAGPVANFILAILLFAGAIWLGGRLELPARVSSIDPNSAAAQAGFQTGDLVKTIDGEPIPDFNAMYRIVTGSAGTPLNFVVERAGADSDRRDAAGLRGEHQVRRHRIGRLGIRSPAASEARLVTYGPVAALGLGVHETDFVVERTFSYLGKLVPGANPPTSFPGRSASPAFRARSPRSAASGRWSG